MAVRYFETEEEGDAALRKLLNAGCGCDWTEMETTKGFRITYAHLTQPEMDKILDAPEEEGDNGCC